MTALPPDSPVAPLGLPALLALGVDFRTAPLELRERVAVRGPQAEEVLLRLMARPEIGEALLLSTCNRTELYLHAREPEPAFRRSLELLFAPSAPEIIDEGRFFVLHDRDAARRLLAIAAGLESMVLGEPEILGQVKQAGELAESVGSVGPVVRHWTRSALRTGSRARSETALGAGAVSLGYAAVELGRQIFDGLSDRAALILGAGETASLVARAFVERGLSDLRFANRSDPRAAIFQAEFPGARRVPFDDRYAALSDADLVVATTGAEVAVLSQEGLTRCMRERQSRPLLVVDLGVPRNVEPAAARLENLFLHDLDSLHGLVKRNLSRRQAEIPRVEAIVSDELTRFLDACRTLEAEPLIAQLQRRAEEIRRHEVELVRERFPAGQHEELDRLTRSLVRRILHHPSHQLRRGSWDDAQAGLRAARQLFQLEDDDEERL